MTRKSNLIATLAATLLTLLAVTSTVRPLLAEDTGQPPAKRIVAIGGSVTEIVYALGQEDRLVARDTTSVFPPEAHSLPDVGYIRALSPEGVMSANPDLILLLEGSGPPETVEVLKKSGIEIAEIPEGFTAQAILEKVKAIGDALGVREEAEVLSASLKEKLGKANSEAIEKTSGAKVMFILSTRGGRILAGGTNTAAQGILELAGAKNAVSDFSGYKQISDEAVISANPDVILMMTRPGAQGLNADELFRHPALGATSAGRNKRLVKMRGQYLLGFSPRTADAIRDLAKQLDDLQS